MESRPNHDNVAERAGTILAYIIIAAVLIVVFAIFGLGDWIYFHWYNNNHYTTAHLNNYINSCEANGDSASMCSCVANSIKDNIPYSQFKTDYQQYVTTGSFPLSVSGYIYDCAQENNT
jgi:hypothetical protein